MKGTSSSAAGRKSTEERRVLRSVPRMAMPAATAGNAATPPGISMGADTEILQKLVRQLRMERAFLETVLEQMPVGVSIAEAPSGRLILGNKKMEELLRETFFAALTMEQYDHWYAYRADGRRYTAKEMPLSRALAYGETVREVMRIRRGDKTFGLFDVSASPIRDEKGLIVAGVVSLQDVSDRPWAQHMFLDHEEKPRAKKR